MKNIVNSMNTLELIVQLRDKGIDLLLDDSKRNLRVVGILKHLTDADKEYLRNHKQALISTLLEHEVVLARKYWEKQYEEEQPLLDLSCFRVGSDSTSKPVQLDHQFSENFSIHIREFAEQRQVAIGTVLAVIVRVLFFRYTGQPDINVYTFTQGEEDIYTVRNCIEGAAGIDALLEQERAAIKEAQRYGAFTFAERAHTFRLQGGLLLTKGAYQGTDYPFDIIFAWKEGPAISLSVTCNGQGYNPDIIGKVFIHLENLFIHLFEKPGIGVDDTGFMTAAEEEEVTTGFNDTQVAYATEHTLLDLIAEQVDRIPDQTAVSFEGKELSYRELHEMSNRFAHYILQRKGLGRWRFIGLNVRKSDDLIIALLGVLKSGHAYVIADPNLPAERLNYILEDADCSLTIDESVILDFYDQVGRFPTDTPDIRITPDDVVYLMYTSGSTGNPKGAINTYRGFTNTINWYVHEMGIGSSDKVGIISNASFDLTQKNYFAPLIAGATIFPDNDFHPQRTADFISRNNITIINSAPVLYYSLLDADLKHLRSLRKIILGGEAIDIRQVNKLQQVYPQVRFYNSYGPSEASDVSVYHMLRENETSHIPIGRPVRNTTVYILDSHERVVPVGVAGEICIGGTGVGLGYLNNEQLSRDKYVDTTVFGRIYKTGDLGRWLPDGNIEFMGRRDQQVKVRGNRVELGEVEVNISRFDEAIKQVVAAVRDVNGEMMLVAYYVAGTSIDKSALREYLLRKLPDYMVPSFYVTLDVIPLTPNGKVNRKALPAVTADDIIRKTYVAPENEIERQLVNLWSVLLNLAPSDISVDSNFFEIGGTSLKLIRMANGINSMEGIVKEVSPVNIFEYPNIRLLAGYLTGVGGKAGISEAVLTASVEVMDETLHILNHIENN